MMVITDEGKKAFIVFASIWGIFFSVIVFLALSGLLSSIPLPEWIIPRVSLGITHDDVVIKWSVLHIGLLYVVAEIHRSIQHCLNKYRLDTLSESLERFDTITSFLPVVTAIITIIGTEWYYSYNGLAHSPWWLWMQILDCIIIGRATIDDIVPTIARSMHKRGWVRKS